MPPTQQTLVFVCFYVQCNLFCQDSPGACYCRAGAGGPAEEAPAVVAPVPSLALNSASPVDVLIVQRVAHAVAVVLWGWSQHRSPQHPLNRPLTYRSGLRELEAVTMMSAVYALLPCISLQLGAFVGSSMFWVSAHPHGYPR